MAESCRAIPKCRRGTSKARRRQKHASGATPSADGRTTTRSSPTRMDSTIARGSTTRAVRTATRCTSSRPITASMRIISRRRSPSTIRSTTRARGSRSTRCPTGFSQPASRFPNRSACRRRRPNTTSCSRIRPRNRSSVFGSQRNRRGSHAAEHDGYRRAARAVEAQSGARVPSASDLLLISRSTAFELSGIDQERGGRMPERWEYRNREEVRDYDRDYDRDYERERNRRGPIERAGDEVRSWFGDHDAARRRRLDEMRGEGERSWTDRDRQPVERTWDRTRETVRDMTDRDRDGRRGLSEWNDDDRPRSFGDTSRYATTDPYPPSSTGTHYE